MRVCAWCRYKSTHSAPGTEEVLAATAAPPSSPSLLVAAPSIVVVAGVSLPTRSSTQDVIGTPNGT
eukprot:COSAG06_NODE_1710_length_8634_cov_767.811365_6_plen_66_part_00